MLCCSCWPWIVPLSTWDYCFKEFTSQRGGQHHGDARSTGRVLLCSTTETSQQLVAGPRGVSLGGDIRGCSCSLSIILHLGQPTMLLKVMSQLLPLVHRSTPESPWQTPCLSLAKQGLHPQDIWPGLVWSLQVTQSSAGLPAHFLLPSDELQRQATRMEVSPHHGPLLKITLSLMGATSSGGVCFCHIGPQFRKGRPHFCLHLGISP